MAKSDSPKGGELGDLGFLSAVTVSLTPSALSALLNGQSSQSPTSGATVATASKPKAPTPPWLTQSTSTTKGASKGSSALTPTSPTVEALLSKINSGQPLVNSSAAKLNVSSTSATANANYKNLFALYSAIKNLQSLASAASASTASSAQVATLQTALNKGLAEVEKFAASASFSGFHLTSGKSSTAETSQAAIPQETDTYQTAPLVKGDISTPVPGLSDSSSFTITVQALHAAPTALTINLADLDGDPPTVPNLVKLINSKLSDAGFQTRFSTVTTASQTSKAHGVTTTTPGTVAMKINGVSNEAIAFSAPTTTPAVYVAQTIGSASSATSTTAATTASQQLVKLNADPSATSASTQVFAKTLASDVAGAQAVATAPDGSVYTVSTVTSSASSASSSTSSVQSGTQGVLGTTDAVLSKYDSTGHLVFSRDLGAQSATGYSLAISPDGSKVAVASAVTGALAGLGTGVAQTSTSASTASGSTKVGSGAGSGSDTVVAVYNTTLGNMAWETRTGSETGDDHPTGVAFGADGSVYVTGQTAAPVSPGASQTSSSDNYLIGLSPSGGQTFAEQYGATGVNHANGVVVVNGEVVTVGQENGQAVVRSFSTSGQAIATRNLGPLQGGDIAGISATASGQLVIAGSTSNPALDVGGVTSPGDGGRDVFVATLSADLTDKGSDSIAYVAQDGPASTAGMTVANGLVYVTGETPGPPIQGQTAASHTGFVTAIDPASGQSTWSTTLAGADGQDIPNGVAVAATGASVLDTLGLPQGQITYAQSDQITSVTNAKAGDSFQITSQFGTRTVTLEQGETLTSLSAKIRAASGGTAKVTTSYSPEGTTLHIAPATATAQLTLVAGPSGSDALQALGLSPGLVSKAASSTATVSSTSSVKVAPYALGLSSSYRLDTSQDRMTAQTDLTLAASKLQSLYNNLVTPKPPASASHSQATTAAPAYLTKELANETAGLQRLGLSAPAANASAPSASSISLDLLQGGANGASNQQTAPSIASLFGG